MQVLARIENLPGSKILGAPTHKFDLSLFAVFLGEA